MENSMSNSRFIKSNKSAKQAKITFTDGLYQVIYGGTMGGEFSPNSYDDPTYYTTLNNAIKYATRNVNK